MKTSDTIKIAVIAGIMTICMIGNVVKADAGAKEDLLLYASEWTCTASTDSDKGIGDDGTNMSIITIHRDGKIDGEMLYPDKDGQPIVGIGEAEVEGAAWEATTRRIGFVQKLLNGQGLGDTIGFNTVCYGQLRDRKYGYLEMQCISAAEDKQGDVIYFYEMHCKRTTIPHD
jgi:hypothetical protein